MSKAGGVGKGDGGGGSYFFPSESSLERLLHARRVPEEAGEGGDQLDFYGRLDGEDLGPLTLLGHFQLGHFVPQAALFGKGSVPVRLRDHSILNVGEYALRAFVLGPVLCFASRLESLFNAQGLPLAIQAIPVVDSPTTASGPWRSAEEYIPELMNLFGHPAALVAHPDAVHKSGPLIRIDPTALGREWRFVRKDASDRLIYRLVPNGASRPFAVVIGTTFATFGWQESNQFLVSEAPWPWQLTQDPHNPRRYTDPGKSGFAVEFDADGAMSLIAEPSTAGEAARFQGVEGRPSDRHLVFAREAQQLVIAIGGEDPERFLRALAGAPRPDQRGKKWKAVQRFPYPFGEAVRGKVFYDAGLGSWLLRSGSVTWQLQASPEDWGHLSMQLMAAAPLTVAQQKGLTRSLKTDPELKAHLAAEKVVIQGDEEKEDTAAGDGGGVGIGDAGTTVEGLIEEDHGDVVNEDDAEGDSASKGEASPQGREDLEKNLAIALRHEASPDMTTRTEVVWAVRRPPYRIAIYHYDEDGVLFTRVAIKKPPQSAFDVSLVFESRPGVSPATRLVTLARRSYPNWNFYDEGMVQLDTGPDGQLTLRSSLRDRHNTPVALELKPLANGRPVFTELRIGEMQIALSGEVATVPDARVETAVPSNSKRRGRPRKEKAVADAEPLPARSFQKEPLPPRPDPVPAAVEPEKEIQEGVGKEIGDVVGDNRDSLVTLIVEDAMRHPRRVKSSAIAVNKFSVGEGEEQMRVKLMVAGEEAIGSGVLNPEVHLRMELSAAGGSPSYFVLYMSIGEDGVSIVRLVCRPEVQEGKNSLPHSIPLEAVSLQSLGNDTYALHLQVPKALRPFPWGDGSIRLDFTATPTQIDMKSIHLGKSAQGVTVVHLNQMRFRYRDWTQADGTLDRRKVSAVTKPATPLPARVERVRGVSPDPAKSRQTEGSPPVGKGARPAIGRKTIHALHEGIFMISPESLAALSSPNPPPSVDLRFVFHHPVHRIQPSTVLALRGSWKYGKFTLDEKGYLFNPGPEPVLLTQRTNPVTLRIGEDDWVCSYNVAGVAMVFAHSSLTRAEILERVVKARLSISERPPTAPPAASPAHPAPPAGPSFATLLPEEPKEEDKWIESAAIAANHFSIGAEPMTLVLKVAGEASSEGPVSKSPVYLRVELSAAGGEYFVLYMRVSSKGVRIVQVSANLPPVSLEASLESQSEDRYVLTIHPRETAGPVPWGDGPIRLVFSATPAHVEMQFMHFGNEGNMSTVRLQHLRFFYSDWSGVDETISMQKVRGTKVSATSVLVAATRDGEPVPDKPPLPAAAPRTRASFFSSSPREAAPTPAAPERGKKEVFRKASTPPRRERPAAKEPAVPSSPRRRGRPKKERAVAVAEPRSVQVPESGSTILLPPQRDPFGGEGDSIRQDLKENFAIALRHEVPKSMTPHAARWNIHRPPYRVVIYRYDENGVLFTRLAIRQPHYPVFDVSFVFESRPGASPATRLVTLARRSHPDWHFHGEDQIQLVSGPDGQLTLHSSLTDRSNTPVALEFKPLANGRPVFTELRIGEMQITLPEEVAAPAPETDQQRGEFVVVPPIPIAVALRDSNPKKASLHAIRWQVLAGSYRIVQYSYRVEGVAYTRLAIRRPDSTVFDLSFIFEWQPTQQVPHQLVTVGRLGYPHWRLYQSTDLRLSSDPGSRVVLKTVLGDSRRTPVALELTPFSDGRLQFHHLTIGEMQVDLPDSRDVRAAVPEVVPEEGSISPSLLVIALRAERPRDLHYIYIRGEMSQGIYRVVKYVYEEGGVQITRLLIKKINNSTFHLDMIFEHHPKAPSPVQLVMVGRWVRSKWIFYPERDVQLGSTSEDRVVLKTMLGDFRGTPVALELTPFADGQLQFHRLTIGKEQIDLGADRSMPAEKIVREDENPKSNTLGTERFEKDSFALPSWRNVLRVGKLADVSAQIALYLKRTKTAGAHVYLDLRFPKDFPHFGSKLLFVHDPRATSPWSLWKAAAIDSWPSDTYSGFHWAYRWDPLARERIRIEQDGDRVSLEMQVPAPPGLRGNEKRSSVRVQWVLELGEAEITIQELQVGEHHYALALRDPLWRISLNDPSLAQANSTVIPIIAKQVPVVSGSPARLVPENVPSSQTGSEEKGSASINTIEGPERAALRGEYTLGGDSQAETDRKREQAMGKIYLDDSGAARAVEPSPAWDEIEEDPPQLDADALGLQAGLDAFWKSPMHWLLAGSLGLGALGNGALLQQAGRTPFLVR